MFLELAEVAAVCRRVNFSYKELDINIIGFDDLLMDIDRIWAEMEPFYANIPVSIDYINVNIFAYAYMFLYLHPSLCKDSIVIKYAFVSIYYR